MTGSELNILGNINIKKSQNPYILLSPSFLPASSKKPYIDYIMYNGSLYGSQIDGSYGIRPAISLKPDTEYLSGTGTMADPYVVKM